MVEGSSVDEGAQQGNLVLGREASGAQAAQRGEVGQKLCLRLRRCVLCVLECSLLISVLE